jgi:hypothetical protein
MGASVDFVVFGFGVSALLMLGGFALRDLGPWLFGSAADPLDLPEFEDAKATIRKQTLASIGTAVSVAGAGVALVTVAALFGKTTDEIGTIVVGMSLVLAAVGVGAWSYDSIRRYRSAMDIVTAQEQSVRTRIQARDARNRALRPDPKAEPKRTPKPKPAAAQAEAADTTTTTAPEANRDTEEEIDLDSPLPDWHGTPTTAGPVLEPEITPVVAETEDSDQPEPEAQSPAITPVTEPPRTTPQPRTTAQPRTTPPLRTTQEPRTTPEPRSTTQPRTTPSPRPVVPTTTSTTRQPAMSFDDALIDEAVRVEPISPFATRGNAPSWLFDDLETDLDQQGSSQDDPIDRFREAKPVSRPSALERLLADDDSEDPSNKGGADT